MPRQVSEHTDSNMGYFEVWYANYPAGQVCTGGNNADGVGSHYIVISSDVYDHGPQAQQERVCEGQTLTIACDTGVIQVLAASYGRQHGAEVCPHSAVSDQECHAEVSGQIVGDACEGEVTCSVSVTNGVFGDPCGGTYKYRKTKTLPLPRVSTAFAAKTLWFLVTVDYLCGEDSRYIHRYRRLTSFTFALMSLLFMSPMMKNFWANSS